MGNLILKFLQEQGILIMMGLIILEGVAHQWVASRRYRRLRTGLQSLVASYSQEDTSRQSGQATYGKGAELAAGPVTEISESPRKRGRRTSRRQEVGRSAPEIVAGREPGYRSSETHNIQNTPDVQQDLDAQLLYLRQSLDRIAAGRDQKLEEEPREQRKLTPEQEAIIADILREYLS